MKKFAFLIPLLMLFSFSIVIAQHDEQAQHKEKRVIVKSISRNSDQKLSDKEIQSIIDSMIILEDVAGQVKVQIIEDKDGNTQLIKSIGDASEINWAPMHAEHQEEMQEPAPNKAIMGVQLNNTGGNNGASILEVYQSSAAEKAGLRKGDIITKIDGKEIIDMNSVISYLSEKNPGDQIKVSYLRSGKKEKVKITLQDSKSNSKSCCAKGGAKCCNKGGGTPSCGNKEVKLMMINTDGENKEIITEQISKEKKIIISKNKSSNGPDDNTATVTVNESNSGSSLILSHTKSSTSASSGKLEIVFKGKNEPFDLQVTNSSGQIIYQEKVMAKDGRYSKEIDIKEVKGDLTVTIKQGTETITENMKLD